MGNVKKISTFKLPRPDWYDVIGENKIGQIIGRIYKDALIENFNAIEAKLKEVQGLDAISIQQPDFSQIDYPDVTLDNDDDGSILNLKSFLKITQCYNYPIDISFNGSKLVKLGFWQVIDGDFDNCKWVEINNKTTGANEDNRYIYCNYKLGTIAASDSASTPIDCMFLGEFIDGKVWTVESGKYLNINVLQYLAKMSDEQVSQVFNSNTRDDSPQYHTEHVGRIIGYHLTNTGTSGNINVTYRDIGRK